MIRSLVVRNALSAVLVAVTIAGIFVQVGHIRQGIAIPQARLWVAVYTIVALYAILSIVVRVSAERRKRR